MQGVNIKIFRITFSFVDFKIHSIIQRGIVFRVVKVKHFKVTILFTVTFNLRPRLYQSLPDLIFIFTIIFLAIRGFCILQRFQLLLSRLLPFRDMIEILVEEYLINGDIISLLSPERV